MSSPLSRFERTALLVWGALFALSSSALLWLQEHLPERVASHFDWSGKVDGWMDRGSFFVVFALILIVANLSIAGLGVYARKNRQSLPQNFGRFGVGFHFPNRSYWLATAERAREVMGRISLSLAATGAFLNLVFLSLFHMIFQENGGAPLVQLPFGLIIASILGMAVVLLGFIQFLFRIPRTD